MDYYESAEGLVISMDRAIDECVKHDASPTEMFEEIGYRDSYDAQEVLAWLGY